MNQALKDATFGQAWKDTLQREGFAVGDVNDYISKQASDVTPEQAAYYNNEAMPQCDMIVKEAMAEIDFVFTDVFTNLRGADMATIADNFNKQVNG